MNNKETLQSYNNLLIQNNDNLQTVIDMINNLPEAETGGNEDLTEELTGYDSKLTLQEEKLNVIVETLKNKMLGAGLPEKGVVITSWDEDGLPLKINVINIQKLKNYMFAGNGEASNMLANTIKAIVIDESATEVGTNCFMNNQSLISVLLSGGALLP